MELREWHLANTTNGNFRIIGKIFNDDKKRFENGTIINTSRLLSIDFEKGIAKTLNSTYKLIK